MKSFVESLLGAMQLSELGHFEFFFGNGRGYQLCLEPLINNALLEGNPEPTPHQLLEGIRFHLALYHKGMLMWPDKIPIRPEYLIMHGPGVGDDQPPARRKALRAQLVALIEAIDIADREAQI